VTGGAKASVMRVAYAWATYGFPLGRTATPFRAGPAWQRGKEGHEGNGAWTSASGAVAKAGEGTSSPELASSATNTPVAR
jgi:hypothetical protein